MPQRKHRSPVFVRLVRDAFARKGRTQRWLAEKAGVDKSTLNVVLKKKATYCPSLDFGLRTLIALGVRPDEYAQQAGYLSRISTERSIHGMTPALISLIRILTDEGASPEMVRIHELLLTLAQDLILAARVRYPPQKRRTGK